MRLGIFPILAIVFFSSMVRAEVNLALPEQFHPLNDLLVLEETDITQLERSRGPLDGVVSAYNWNWSYHGRGTWKNWSHQQRREYNQDRSRVYEIVKQAVMSLGGAPENRMQGDVRFKDPLEIEWQIPHPENHHLMVWTVKMRAHKGARWREPALNVYVSHIQLVPEYEYGD